MPQHKEQDNHKAKPRRQNILTEKDSAWFGKNGEQTNQQVVNRFNRHEED